MFDVCFVFTAFLKKKKLRIEWGYTSEKGRGSILQNFFTACGAHPLQ